MCTPPFEKSPFKRPRVLCTPPFEKSPIKAHRFCVLPPLKNHPSKAIGFVYSPPPLKNHYFWWALISGGRLLSHIFFPFAEFVTKNLTSSWSPSRRPPTPVHRSSPCSLYWIQPLTFASLAAWLAVSSRTVPKTLNGKEIKILFGYELFFLTTIKILKKWKSKMEKLIKKGFHRRTLFFRGIFLNFQMLNRE